MFKIVLISSAIILQLCNSHLDASSFVPGDTKKTELKLDLDASRNASEIIQSRGFGCKEYNVTTRDGYILTIQRIINPMIKSGLRNELKPIIMTHGLFASSIEWIIDSPNVRPEVWPHSNHNKVTKVENNETRIDTQEHPNALGFYMANRGYDVWLSNNRCNLYGQKHVNLSATDPRFWDFSLDEIITFDLPDTIDFVKKITKKSKIGFVGFSQGTFGMFGLLSDRPEYADVIEPFVALAPIAFVNHIKTPLRYLAPLEPSLRHLNSPFFAPATFIRSISPIICEPMILRRELCENIIFIFSGFNEFESNLERSSSYLAHIPSGSSIKQVNHFLQLIKSGKFGRYNHGAVKNKRLYNSSRPLDYQLSRIRSKSIVLFVSANDWLANPEDVSTLLRSLTVEPYAIYNISNVKPRWNHFDFIHSINTGEIVNTRVEKVFKAFNQNQQQ